MVVVLPIQMNQSIKNLKEKLNLHEPSKFAGQFRAIFGPIFFWFSAAVCTRCCVSQCVFQFTVSFVDLNLPELVAA